MKARLFSGRKKVISLYIPHGSDESIPEANIIQLTDDDFISHMVQMKVLCVMLMKCQTMIFISHMVQMKVTSLEERRHEACFLYIPHGSDERFFFLLYTFIYIYFISHMVQMKV